MTLMRMITIVIIAAFAGSPAVADDKTKTPKPPIIDLSDIESLPPSDYIIEIFDVPIEDNLHARRLVIDPIPDRGRYIPRSATYKIIRDSEAFISAEDREKNLQKTGVKSGKLPEGRRSEPLKPAAAIGIRSKF